MKEVIYAEPVYHADTWSSNPSTAEGSYYTCANCGTGIPMYFKTCEKCGAVIRWKHNRKRVKMTNRAGERNVQVIL